ncbi:MAG: Rpp14/Pop5 family protein [Candidatus Micrarchaeaceae archaeon]
MIREKKRYVLVRLSHPTVQDEKKFASNLMAEMMRYMGTVDYSTSNIRVIRQEGQRLIVSVSLAAFGKFILATSFIRRVGGEEIGLNTIKSSGSIKALLS